jgi:hypothetical protein
MLKGSLNSTFGTLIWTYWQELADMLWREACPFVNISSAMNITKEDNWEGP